MAKETRRETGAAKRTPRGKSGTVLARASGERAVAKAPAAKPPQRGRRRKAVAKVKAATSRKGPAKRLAAKKPTRPVPAPRVVKIQALDPQRKCGLGTTVLHLFRVDERTDGVAATHLVFFDRHGWYCEHGRNCPAVADVRRQEKQLDRTLKVG